MGHLPLLDYSPCHPEPTQQENKCGLVTAFPSPLLSNCHWNLQTTKGCIRFIFSVSLKTKTCPRGSLALGPTTLSKHPNCFQSQINRSRLLTHSTFK